MGLSYLAYIYSLGSKVLLRNKKSGFALSGIIVDSFGVGYCIMCLWNRDLILK